MKTFEFWRQRGSGLIFAIMLEDGIVAGCCGPLDRGDVDEDDLARCDFTPERAEWIEAHREEFDLYATSASV